MDRHEAEKALGIIRQVIQNTQEDLIEHNWGLIWMIHAFTNLTGVAMGTLIDRRELSVYWYLAPLSAVALVDIVIVLLVVKRDHGVRSYIEWQLHGIWVTFITFTIVAVGVLHLAGAPPRLFGPLFAMTSGIGFAMMGVVFYRRFLIYAGLFLAVMIAACLHPSVQWWLIGAAWWSAMFFPGLSMFREASFVVVVNEAPPFELVLEGVDPRARVLALAARTGRDDQAAPTLTGLAIYRRNLPRTEGPRAEGPRAEGPRAEGPREGDRTPGAVFERELALAVFDELSVFFNFDESRRERLGLPSSEWRPAPRTPEVTVTEPPARESKGTTKPSAKPKRKSKPSEAAKAKPTKVKVEKSAKPKPEAKTRATPRKPSDEAED